MLLLALDTSTPAGTVAVHDGNTVRAEATTIDARRHTEVLMPLVVDVLRRVDVDRADLTEIAVGAGPGPFTGLRVGLSAARTMGFALGIPVRGVCSLDIIAHGVRQGRPFVVATDARRKEVYWAAYDADGSRITDPDVGTAAAIADDERVGRRPAAGAGGRLYPEAFDGVLDPEFPSAALLADAVVTGAIATIDPEPLYLRRPDVTMSAGRKSVLG